ncbi:MAG: hypothetical protein ABIQ95_14600 [Bdellovibrionia bacterium]
MKKISLLFNFIFVFFTIPAWAELPSSFSLNVGVTAIAEEVGYSFGATTPYFINDKSALSFQYSQFRASASSTYSMIEVGALNKFLSFDKVNTYFKGGSFYTMPGNPALKSDFGINFGFGANIAANGDKFLFKAEIGYYYPLGTTTEQVAGQPFAQGAGISLGFMYLL